MLSVDPPILHQGRIPLFELINTDYLVFVQAPYGLYKQFIKCRISFHHRHFDGFFLFPPILTGTISNSTSNGFIPVQLSEAR